MDQWIELTEGRWVNLGSAVSITFEPTVHTLRILYPVMGLGPDATTLDMMHSQPPLWTLRLDGRDAQIVEEHFRDHSPGNQP